MLRASCLVLGALAATVALTPTVGLTAQSPSPQSVASELLAADRAFSKAAASLTVVDAIGAMLADDAIVPGPGGVWVEGKAKAIEAMKSNPDNVALRGPKWEPIGGGISADGRHGYTYGFMEIPKPPATLHAKYMTYWTKTAAGWRASVYKRRPSAAPSRAAGAAPKMLMPDRIETTVYASVEVARASLTAAEKNFSDEAQKIGLGPAFEKNGSADAVNMGAPTSADFTYGNVEIAKNVGAGGPAGSSPVSWAADFKTIVAASGDLGITIGFIRPNAPGADGTPGPPQPFFTIWRRANGIAPWKYVAE